MLFRILAFLVRHPGLLRLVDPWFGLYNPLRSAHRRDPYPQYRALRERAPVYLHPLLGIWFLTRYEDGAGVLRDARFLADRTRSNLFRRRDPFAALPPAMREGILRSLLMLDPPDHTRLRGLVNRAFTPRVVEQLRPRIQALVDEALDAAAPRGEMDLVRDLAYPLPVTVIAELLGVPADDRERLKRWSDDLTVVIDPIGAGRSVETAAGAFQELSAYFETIFEARRQHPRDDLVSALVAAEQEGERLRGTELLSLCALILGAGHETTTNLVGNAVLALLRHPGERKRLQDDPGLIESAVEEFLRFDSPVQATDRVASEDCEIGGQRIEAGRFVAVLIGAANRDPARFPEPDRLDLGRADNRHLSFGHGVHYCLGAPLARVEAQIAVGTLLRRFPDLEGPTEPPGFLPSLTLRGPTALPLSLRGGA